MKKRSLIAVIAAVLVAAAVVTALVLTGVIGRENREITWANMGDGGKIPCVAIAGAEHATTEDFRYIFRKANQVDIDPEWGVVTKTVKAENKPIVNVHYGDEVYLTRYTGTTLEQYQRLLEDMQYAGFTLYAQSQLNGDVHTASLAYQENTYTVTHFVRTGVTDVTASQKMKLSPYLLPENESAKTQQTGSVTMQVLSPRSTGSGCVIQLKNGNFVIFDGGNVWETGKLLNYLEENTPEGQLPVVEAWFITAADYDRSGWNMAFISQKSDLEYLPELFEPVPAAERLVVNGIYYNKPSPDTVKVASFKEAGTVEGTTYYKKNDSAWPGRVSEAAKKLLTQTGEQTPVYRPMAGQIYHFSGLDVEITWSHEQITMAEYDFDVRTANACYMLRAEGKSVLNMGSASKVVQDHMVETYTDTYWKDLTVLFTPHYGRRLFECYKDVFRAELICFENNTPEIIVDEALKVVQYYENLPESRCYWYKDGNFRYDFASGEITVTPNQNESR